MGEGSKSSMRMWGNVGWWIAVVLSVPFALYTLPFIYGDFDIYKHVIIAAQRGDYEVAGLHILHNLRTWQIHAAAALLFLAIGPFQFNASFRNKNPALHRQLGYIFALCTIITAVTGATTMNKASELGPMSLTALLYMSIATMIALAISISAARNKEFQSHRRWMLRSAAIGYSVVWTRFLPGLVSPLIGVSDPRDATDVSLILALVLSCCLSEMYIQTYLTQLDRKAASRQSATESTLSDRMEKKVL